MGGNLYNTGMKLLNYKWGQGKLLKKYIARQMKKMLGKKGGELLEILA